MAGPLAFLVVLGFFVAAWVIRAAGGTARFVPPEDPAGLWRAARRRAVAFQWAGLAVAVPAALWVATSFPLGRGMLAAGPVFGLVFLIGVVAGELSVRPPAAAVLSATLQSRRWVDYLPRRLARVVAAAGLALVAASIGTTWSGSADDLGRAGRTLAYRCDALTTMAFGPWPGSYYTLPAMAVVAAGVLLTGVALARIARRPRFGGSAFLTEADDALRRRAAQTVTACCGVLFGLPLLGIGVTAGLGLVAHDCLPPAARVAGWLLVAAVPLALGLLGWCAAALVNPGLPARQGEREASAA